MANQFLDDGMDIVTLTDEDGVETDFQIIDVREKDGVTYYALTPIDENGGDDDSMDFVILKAEVDENGEEILVTIDDDDEFDEVADLFEDIQFDEVDYDEDDDDNNP